jgi:hypothetical protein
MQVKSIKNIENRLERRLEVRKMVPAGAWQQPATTAGEVRTA